MKISDLPGDLLEDILCRVPATSLMRLRNTCKRWNHLFTDSRFARKHLDKTAKQFQILAFHKFMVCPMSVDLQSGVPFIEERVLSLDRSRSDSAEQTKINQVSYCDGLLLCTIQNLTRIVVWNPFTRQTKWIETGNHNKKLKTYTFGSYLDNDTRDYSYKILSGIGYRDLDFEICEVGSDHSWRVLDISPGCDLSIGRSVSLKGKTYWFGSQGKEKPLGMFLVSFDYTKERFERMDLPCHSPEDGCRNMAMSVVREEKLSLLSQCPNTLRKEIWVTNKIDDETTKAALSWIKILTIDNYSVGQECLCVASFVVHEEKKVVVSCERWIMYVVGEGKRVRRFKFGAESGDRRLRLFSYVPSFIPIQ